MSNSICHVPLIVCDTGARALSAVAKYNIVSYLSHDIVRGFDWLRTFKPLINWWACTLSIKVPSGHHLPAGLPCNSTSHVKVASLDSICKEVDRALAAWFILFHLVEPPDGMGACGTLVSGESGDT